MFVSNDTLAEIADDMQSVFETILHSQSSIREIADVAQEALADRGLPTRRSLAIVVAKMALMRWHATIEVTKAQAASSREPVSNAQKRRMAAFQQARGK